MASCRDIYGHAEHPCGCTDLFINKQPPQSITHDWYGGFYSLIKVKGMGYCDTAFRIILSVQIGHIDS